MRQVDLMEPAWVGAAEVAAVADGGVRPWRLPVGDLGLLDERAQFQAGNPSGVRLRFTSDTQRVLMTVEPEAERTRWFDLLADGALVGRVELAPEQEEVTFDGLVGGEKTLELWLNHMYAPVVVRGLQVDAGATFKRAEPTSQQRLLFYGSSISHGRKAAGPTESWPVGAARRVGVEPINLGLGGACIMQPTLARHIRDTSADYLNFCIGINMVTGYTHNERSFRTAVTGFIQIVREGHPDTPLAIQSPIHCGPIETSDEKASFPLVRCREILAEVVDCFQQRGDERILYTDGLDVLGAEDEGCLFDGIHPDAEGHPLMSQRYAERVWPRLQALARNAAM